MSLIILRTSRQLEDALEISHAANSSHNHPLLREELLSIKRGVAMAPTPAAQEGEADAPEGDYVEAMGTMSISERGISRFIGRTGGGESLFLVSASNPHYLFGSQATLMTFPAGKRSRAGAYKVGSGSIIFTIHISKVRCLALYGTQFVASGRSRKDRSQYAYVFACFLAL